MNGTQSKKRKAKKKRRSGDAWHVYDPGHEIQDGLKSAAIEFAPHLFRDERTSPGLLRLVVKNLPLVILAIRPEPVVAPATKKLKPAANVVTS